MKNILVPWAGFVFVTTDNRTHLRKQAQEDIGQYETPRWAQKGSFVTAKCWSGTVHLRSERHREYRQDLDVSLCIETCSGRAVLKAFFLQSTVHL